MVALGYKVCNIRARARARAIHELQRSLAAFAGFILVEDFDGLFDA